MNRSSELPPEALEVFAEFLEQYAAHGGQMPPTPQSVRRFFKTFRVPKYRHLKPDKR